MENKQKGLIHIYCGDGKGKTTAAIGLCVRAAGNGKKILLTQYLKSNKTGELEILKMLPNVTVVQGPDKMKFSIDMTQCEKEQLKKQYENDFMDMAAKSADYDMFVMDEVIYAVDAGFFPEETLIEFLTHKPGSLEVVMTGQRPTERLLFLSDYVSEIKKIKHPYDRGIKSRKGIEK